MKTLPTALNGCLRLQTLRTLRTCLVPRPGLRRGLLTLAIETSCDDTSVAVLERTRKGPGGAVLHFHKKVTSNNASFRGVHPIMALESHQENLAGLVAEAIDHLPRPAPDFVAVTRGPGMRSNLFTGLDTAKGLAVAWKKPLVGVHHMQAHALTPRLVHALQPDGTGTGESIEPDFPFLSVLASGGHTLLIHSTSLTQHTVMGSTIDAAIGDCLDKIARLVLPAYVLQEARGTMYGALLEDFAFPKAQSQDETQVTEKHARLEDSSASDYRKLYSKHYAYEVPKNHEEATKRSTKWGWGFNQPLAKANGGLKYKTLEMSFSGLTTAVQRTAQYQFDTATGKPTKTERSPGEFSIAERKDMAREAMRAAFEHVASRVVLGLQQLSLDLSSPSPVNAIVMAGGVAANTFLRYILSSNLCAHGYPDVRIVFPPPSFCTDNAAMIAWAGLEMYEAGYVDPLNIRAIRKWPLDHLLSPPKDDLQTSGRSSVTT